jgi:hypothetical protein
VNNECKRPENCNLQGGAKRRMSLLEMDKYSIQGSVSPGPEPFIL